MNSQTTSRARGLTCALAAMLIWSTTAIQVKLLQMDSFSLTAISNLVAAACLGGWLLVTRQPAQLTVALRHWRFLLLFGFGALINAITYFLAFANTSTANTLISHYTAPVMVLLLAPIFIRERVSWFALFPLLLALWGMWLITGGTAISSQDMLGIIYGLVSALGYAVVMLAARRIPAGLTPLAIMFWQSVICAAGALPFVTWPLNYDPAFAPFMLTFGAFNVALAGALFFRSFAALKAFTVAILGYIEPVGAIFLAWLVLGETLTMAVAAGGCLILLSGLLVIWYENRITAANP